MNELVPEYHMYYLLHDDGTVEPTEYHAVAMLQLRDEKRIIARYEKTIGKYILKVSTVFLVINHGMPGEQPVLFETLFFLNGNSIDNSMLRYHTLRDALKGHNETIKIMEEALKEAMRTEYVTGQLLDVMIKSLIAGEE
jgi:hypothetical protein